MICMLSAMYLILRDPVVVVFLSQHSNVGPGSTLQQHCCCDVIALQCGGKGKNTVFVYIKLSPETNGKHFKCFLYQLMQYNKSIITLGLLLAKFRSLMLVGL